MEQDVLVALVGVCMAVGVAGTVVPFVPGLALVWGAALVYGLVDGFGVAGAGAFAAITGLAVAGMIAGVALPRRAAGAAGAAPSSVFVGLALAVVGGFVVPVVGFALGGLLGIFLAERIRTSDHRAAWRATMATLRGLGLAAIVQFGVAVAMVGVWAGWVWAA